MITEIGGAHIPQQYKIVVHLCGALCVYFHLVSRQQNMGVVYNLLYIRVSVVMLACVTQELQEQ